MKMPLQRKMFYWVIFVLLLAKCENISFCAEQDPALLDKLVKELKELADAGKTNEYFEKVKAYDEVKKAHSATNWENICSEQEAITVFDRKLIQLEEIWEAGKTNEYFEKAKVITKDIQAHPAKNNLNGVAAKLLDKLMAKKLNIIDDSSNYDLYAMDDLACRLLSNDIKERRTTALLLCRFLGKIRKEIIPNYKDKPVSLNVSPPRDAPPQRSPYFSGMDPAAITNPVVRAQYEAAIRENQENSNMNGRQGALRSVCNELTTKSIIDYIIKTFRGDDTSAALLAECIKVAGLTDKEKEEVLKKVSVKQPKQGKINGAALQGQQNIK
ncbi:MAG: hypothetical protein Q7J98_09230 [Kiritimatiellia bacterium]|nr:hypothetical protein [Kiritimatiellia bacterium]